jgi:hypothetical protein
MFYWSIKGHEIVLTTAEERALVQLLSGDIIEERAMAWLAYNTKKSARRHYERRIFSYLRDLFTDNYPEFCHRYYQRDVSGERAVDMLSVLLVSYGRITKLASTGRYGKQEELYVATLFGSHEITSDDQWDPITETIKGGKVYWITLFHRRLFRWLPLKPLSHICFPVPSIRRVEGTVQSFTLHTSCFVMRFQPNIVEISQFSGGENPTSS